MQNTLNIVLVILSIGTIIGPIFFGFVLFKMTSIFVTRQQFEDYKILMETERRHQQTTLERIEKGINELRQKKSHSERE